jgi:hypothetical protein
MKEAARPTTSKVAELVFGISYENDPIIEGEKCFGYCDEARQLIVMDETLDDSVMRHYLVHEIIEQMNCVYGIDLTHPQISALATIWASYIRENGDVMEYLVGGE